VALANLRYINALNNNNVDDVAANDVIASSCPYCVVLVGAETIIFPNKRLPRDSKNSRPILRVKVYVGPETNVSTRLDSRRMLPLLFVIYVTLIFPAARLLQAHRLNVTSTSCIGLRGHVGT